MEIKFLLIVYLTDLIFGDPEWFKLHPVRLMGRLIEILDEKMKRNGAVLVDRIKGMVLVFTIVGISSLSIFLFIKFFYMLNKLLGYLALILIGFTAISIKDLKLKARDVLLEIDRDIHIARKKLSMIVSRDTKDLDKEKIIIATVESVAENTNDGIVAPLFYLALGGPVLAIAYKAINTLDSMVGYKNQRYKDFGWFAARLDDLVNFIPARITGIMIAISSFILKKGFILPFYTMLRDGMKSTSPNAGVSMAAMAGALRIRFGGSWSYEGIEVIKPYIGKQINKIEPYLIDEALNISLLSSFLMLVSLCLVKLMI